MKYYKYNIKDRLENLPINEYRELMYQIPKALKKSKRTFLRYTTITMDDPADIPALDLDIIAFFLGCNAQDLKNYTLEDFRIKNMFKHFKFIKRKKSKLWVTDVIRL